MCWASTEVIPRRTGWLNASVTTFDSGSIAKAILNAGRKSDAGFANAAGGDADRVGQLTWITSWALDFVAANAIEAQRKATPGFIRSIRGLRSFGEAGRNASSYSTLLVCFEATLSGLPA